MAPTERHGSRQTREVRGSARARILDTAYELFSTHGIRAVGIDRIIAEAGVAKMTLYQHFESKQDLALAFLELREQRWTRAWLEAEIELRGGTPRERLLAIFDALDEWFHRPDYEGCSFLNTLLEIHETNDPLYQEAVHQLVVIREMIEHHARQAGTPNPAMTASQLQILMIGAIVSASSNNRDAARDARELAESLLEITD